MDIIAAYQFLFETTTGIACLILGLMVLSLVLAIVLEGRTRRKYADRGEAPSIWDDIEDEDEEKDA